MSGILYTFLAMYIDETWMEIDSTVAKGFKHVL